MRKKYEIIDLSKHPRDLRAGDMVKLRKGMRIGKHYDGFTFYKSMRFRYYRTIEGLSINKNIMITDEQNLIWYYPTIMLDLTCVKRWKDEETV